jgi:hypothetical protein
MKRVLFIDENTLKFMGPLQNASFATALSSRKKAAENREIVEKEPQISRFCV